MSSKTDIKDRHYLKHLEGIKEAYQKAESWRDVVASDYFYSDENKSMEAFIDYVEEVYKTKVKDAKELEKLTGLTALLPKEQNIEKGKEPTLDYILTSSRYSKYFRALETALDKGATYPELLQISPNKFNLPKDFKRENIVGSDSYNSILWAISFTYLIDEPAGVMLLPSLRSIAEEIKAPYSVIMDAYNLTRY
jgi:hypothetical protein